MKIRNAHNKWVPQSPDHSERLEAEYLSLARTYPNFFSARFDDDGTPVIRTETFIKAWLPGWDFTSDSLQFLVAVHFLLQRPPGPHAAPPPMWVR